MVKVGPPHFKRLVKEILGSGYTHLSALNDIIDNVRSTNIDICSYENNSIRISDDDPEGFKNIEKENIDNPFNLGHICVEQTDDTISSEYGVGLKKASIYLCKTLIVYTKINFPVEKFFQVIMDFDKMAAEEDPSDSYQPEIKEISKKTYFKRHTKVCGFSTGSSIYLNDLRSSTDTINIKGEELSEEEIIEYKNKVLSESLVDTYSKKIQKKEKIRKEVL